MTKQDKKRYTDIYESLKQKPGIYLPENNENTVALIKEAWLTNLGRDEMERKSGMMANSDCPLDLQLRTAITALLAGFAEMQRNKTEDAKGCFAEAIAMIQFVEMVLREKGKK